MKQYLEALNHILENGESVEDRTGVGTTAVFGYQMRFNLQEGFPAVTTKKLAWRSVVSELLWFLEGSDDERELAEIHYGKPREELVDKTTIWTANANAQGAALGYTNTDTEKRLGPVYGVQWRSWPTEWRGWDHHGTIDQIQTLIEGLKNDPDSRRHILSAWNVAEIDKMALPPCHTLAQFRVMNGKLSCQLYQRSADMGLGVPFNIASYSLLTHMLAQICDLNVGDFVWSGGDCHIYNNHIPAIKEQIKREPKTLPSLTMPKFDSLETLLETKPTDYVLNDYDPMSSIKMDMAV